MSCYLDLYELAQKYDLTSYDAAYLEPVFRLRAALATNNTELMDVARQAGVTLL